MQSVESTILIVDDEQYTLEFLSYNLTRNGFNVVTATNGKDAIKKAELHKPAIIVLDIMMPEMDGIETCIELRKNKLLNDSAIAFLSCRGEDYTQIIGFEAGADDFIKKPIRINLLIERLKALERRMNKTREKLPVNKSLIIDEECFVVNYLGNNIELTKKEFELLHLLYKNPGKTISRDDLFNNIWSGDEQSSSRTIHVHISRIRNKLDPDVVQTVKGFGYRYKPPEA
ncbi:MAG: response regulator transcription factor [Bacteroidales bacterium]